MNKNAQVVNCLCKVGPWRSQVKRLVISAYCWHLIGVGLTQSIVDRLQLWEA